MPLHKIYAHLNCADLDASIRWFSAVFNRGPDERPMEGLAEWHHAGVAGFQLFQNPEDAGRGVLTLIVGGSMPPACRPERSSRQAMSG